MSFTMPALRARTVALVTLNAVLAALLVLCAWRGTQTRSLLGTAPRPIPLKQYSLVRPAMTTNLAAIQDRALLYAARSVYMPPLAGNSPPKPQYRLVGTFIIPFKPGVALLSSANGAARKVKPGDSLDGWLVEAVEDRRVVLRHESETFDIASTAAGKPGLTLQSAPLARQTPPVAGNRILGSSEATAPTAPMRLTSGATAPNVQPLTPRLYTPPPKR